MAEPPKKKARRQADKAEAEYVQPAGEYNIWYHKRLGEQDFAPRERATTMCDPERDAGVTKADSLTGFHYHCLYFAKGKCVHGHKCNFYHRVPTPDDARKLPLTHDIFGRERHSSYRDDMGGVGCIHAENKTVYVGGLKEPGKGNSLERQLREKFGLFGDVEYVRVLKEKMCAFVRFRFRANAEFAKEAMTDQTLGNDETLNCRWSREDPNPLAKRYEEQERARIATQTLLKAHPDLQADAKALPAHLLSETAHPYKRLEKGQIGPQPKPSAKPKARTSSQMMAGSAPGGQQQAQGQQSIIDPATWNAMSQAEKQAFYQYYTQCYYAYAQAAQMGGPAAQQAMLSASFASPAAYGATQQSQQRPAGQAGPPSAAAQPPPAAAPAQD
eukprot:CAMPEP_0114628490 /NCGR_PEP_ID=MMETSP0168-20121206/12848_1 /TAXON_ID=95228 ORGANISM="Vannella sp., Strain DIVA3 517/6/12" /NCGR_SAMPLE_ID=MMETSP0168 /ASSEMBLY_ACC=CAM_ASM_000044 /LENGTH=385 /DNA_ID=CAMNT_0001839875 /DNA_START=38 /DNA_END=1192 /DNA_ORIENTATION=+